MQDQSSQDNQIKQVSFQTSIFRIANAINIILLVLIFYINFTGSSYLKWIYLAQVFLALFAASSMDLSDSFFFIIPLFFTEGQGRIVWSYQPWAVIIFDVVLLMAIARTFIKKRVIYNRKKIPVFLILFIALHFFWFFVQFFNYQSINLFENLSTMKIYIFPFFLFFLFSNEDWNFTPKKQKLFVYILLLIIFLECFLCIFQMQHREEFMISLHPYYEVTMRNKIFTGLAFRPFGTSFYPGAISAYLFLTLGLFFINKVTSLQKILLYFLMPLSWFTLYISQVRSALIKHFILFLFIHLALLLTQRYRFKRLIKLIPPIILLFILSPLIIPKFATYFPDIDFSKSQQRFEQLNNLQAAATSRLSFDRFFHRSLNSLAERPLGNGIASTRFTKDKNDLSLQLINNKKWHFDNLFLSLIIEFGIGSLFYIIIIFSIPIYLFGGLILSIKYRFFEEINILVATITTLIVIIIGNWGAVGIPYNPESFIFWFFSATGFTILYTIRQKISLLKK